ncbi:receptor-like protein 15 isoform X2 [Hevea brasiliensis]|uniref:receptor-like protein 15 isoform X2 n=1 Tax=Hevea brasiliensis TaxID=3981 RepID=UPI0025FC43D5|nr:receptor-like protein 15 isoform X2 [Hevea brasiliensis]
MKSDKSITIHVFSRKITRNICAAIKSLGFPVIVQKIKSLADKNPTMRIVILYLALPAFLLFLNCEGCNEEERDALFQIKNSINSPVGTAFSSWYGQDCCQWEGVECDESNSRVIRIIFQYLRTAQELKSEAWYPNATLFTQFKDLQELYLPGNRIGGFISSNALYKLKHLQKLDLQDNVIDNSSLCWGNIPTLHYVNLSRNKLQGYIPQCLCDSQSMTELILSHNELEGNIDGCLSNMTSLKHLSLSDNSFYGTFPSLLFHNLTNIESLDISNNRFKDVISFSIFANLSKLLYLDISYNPDLEIETESPSWSPSFSLNQLGLGGCNLNRRSGRNIPSFLSMQNHLQSLDLSYNSLFGSFPSWLPYNISSELWIRGNNLSGPFPKIGRNMSSQLATLDISDNNLFGLFPADIRSYFPHLARLNVSHNMFDGTIQSIGELSQLRYLDLSNNNFQGGIPHEIMSNSTYLEYLSLSRNNLQGKALPRNSSLPNLKWLYLDRNGFTGSFPDGVSKFSSLLFLEIHHNDLSGDLSISFPVLAQLRGLSLRRNRLKGSIPLQLCQMKHLHVLDLSENDLSVFNVSFNNLTGPTPLVAQFSTFDDSSYLGNPNLCGPLLKKECNMSVEKSQGKRSKKTLAEIMESSILIFVVHIFLLCLVQKE